MKHRRAVAEALCLLTFCLVISSEARAQSRQPLQLGVGYQFLHESVDRGGENFPVGAYVDIERTITSDQVKAWGWMAQFEAGFRRDSGFPEQLYLSEQLYTYLGGIRLASTRKARWTPSGFGLVGLATENASCADYCAGTNSGLALQGGFAMTTRLNASTLLDIAFKASKLRIEGTGVFNAAIAAGVRFTLKK